MIVRLGRCESVLAFVYSSILILWTFFSKSQQNQVMSSHLTNRVLHDILEHFKNERFTVYIDERFFLKIVTYGWTGKKPLAIYNLHSKPCIITALKKAKYPADLSKMCCHYWHNIQIVLLAYLIVESFHRSNQFHFAVFWSNQCYKFLKKQFRKKSWRCQE